MQYNVSFSYVSLRPGIEDYIDDDEFVQRATRISEFQMSLDKI